MKVRFVECASLGVRVPEKVAQAIDHALKGVPDKPELSYRKRSLINKAAEHDAAERTDVAVITTDHADLEKEVILTAGVELDYYRKSAVVLWDHDTTRPIGRCLWVKSFADGEGAGIKAKTHYTRRPAGFAPDVEWYPDYVWGLVQAGVVTGKSVGLKPLEVREPTEAERANPRYAGVERVISKSILVEYSTTPAPVNPHTVIEMVKSLQTAQHPPAKAIAPATTAADALRAASLADLARLRKSLREIDLDPGRIADRVVRRVKGGR